MNLQKILHGDIMINTGEQVSVPKGLESFNDREINWAWKISNIDYGYGSALLTHQKRNQLFAFINNLTDKSNFIDNLINQKQNYLLDLKHFEWINRSDDRLLIFCINTFYKNTNLFSQINTTHTNNYDYFLDIFDSNNIDINSKFQFLNNIKNSWILNETPFKEIKWINKNNEIQIHWANEYLIKHSKNAFIALPSNKTQNLFNLILASLDLMQNNANRTLFLLQMKKTWSQKKFRDSGKAKKPYHIPLTDDSHKKLSFLSEHLNKSIPHVLDFIINKVHNEYKKDNGWTD